MPSLPACAAQADLRLCWRRVFIKAGGSEVVKFSVDVASELKLLGRDFNWVVEPGAFKVMVGGSSADAGGDHCGGDAHGRCAQGQFSVG